MERFGSTSRRNTFEGVNFPESVKPLPMHPLRQHGGRTRPIVSRSPEVYLRSLVPDRFPAYARILHPAYTEDLGTPVRWADVAAQQNKIAHPLMKFGWLSGFDDPYAEPLGIVQPEIGQLPYPEAKALASILRGSTTTPEQCQILVWEGYSGMELMYPETAKAQLPDRSYWAYEGSIDGALELFENNYLFGPNLWWPKDMAWFVYTDIDFMDTYIGGSEECVTQILCDPDLESYPANLDDRVDF